jgi:peptide/nickel transport system substrate-binding protein
MSDDDNIRRRRFLQATSATALTVGLAGCSGGGDSGDDGSGDDGTSGDDGMSGDDSTDGEDGEYEPSSSYPYGANETLIEEAQQVMEDAGYGPDNRYELDWLQYQSGSWEEMANTIRSRLDSAYIDMNISQADFGALLETTQEQGSHEAFTSGWIADYPGVQNFLQLIDPENTVYDAQGYTPNGATLYWSEDIEGDSEVRQYITEQFDRIQDNPEQSDEAQQVRNDACLKMERALWDSAALIPIYHRVDELFWYDRVDYDPPAGMGPSRAKTTTSVQGLEGSSTLNGISTTFSSLDPIASGNTASGTKIMDMFDAPLNYPNGRTEVENLLIEDYTVSDDLTEYEFTLKEGVQFHGDYGEVTADDMVYSIRRLVESENSTNTYFPNSVLNIVRETDEEGNTVPDSTAVEATGDYTFTIELENPFGFALSVLAYSAFSAVPEGIVGDIEGYDGDMSWEEFSTNPVGCGPFVFEEWQSGNGGEFRASAFEDYHGDTPGVVDELQSAIITEDSARYNYLINGNADVAGIPTTQYDPSNVSINETNDEGQNIGTYEASDAGVTLNMSQTPSINTFYVGFHMEKVPKPVRQAMAYVINREQFVDDVFKSRGAPAVHLTPPQIFPGGQSGYDDNWQE